MDEERPNITVLQSYVFHQDKAWFVSTIERTFDVAIGSLRGLETLVWTWNKETRERGDIVHQLGGIDDHFNVCRGLLRDGKWEEGE